MIRSRLLFRRVDVASRRRCFSLPTRQSAMLLLKLDPYQEVTTRVLREAYLKAAWRFHPDVQKSMDGEEFAKINDAYEVLQSGVVPEQDLGITPEEEKTFRTSCQEWLGLPGEVVEECKRCPIFREWLSGKSDGAIRWQQFLIRNGGLAPMLPRHSGLLEELSEVTKVMGRRKKR